MDRQHDRPRGGGVAARDDGPSDRVRFEEDFKAMRTALREGRHFPEADVAGEAHVLPPGPPAIQIVIQRRDVVVYRDRFSYAPQGLVRAAKLVALCAVGSALYYGPPYYTCRQLKEGGHFYYGTTVRSCVQERLDARADRFNAVAARLMTVL